MSDIKVAYVWAKGYASEEGLQKFEFEGTSELAANLARAKFGSFATVSYIVDKTPKPITETFSADYIRMMSRDS